MALVTPERCLTVPAGAAIPNTGTPGYLTTLIEVASRLIESYCHRPFYFGDWYESFSQISYEPKHDKQCLYLTVPPINTIYDVTMYYLDKNAISYDLSEIFSNSTIGKLLFKNYIEDCNLFTITVRYSGGYLVIPEDLQEACVQLVLLLAEPGLRTGQDLTLLSETLGDYSYVRRDPSLYSMFTPTIRAILSQYVNYGSPGVLGFQGTQGPQGFQGWQGVGGPQGFQGPLGYQGSRGY